MFVFIVSSTAKVISKHRSINVVSQHGVEPGIFRFQCNQEAHYVNDANLNSTTNIPKD